MTERNQGPSAVPLWPALLTVLLCAGLSLPAAPAAAEEAEDLNTFKVCQSRTGYLSEGPQPPLELRWKFQSRESRHDIEGFPSVDDT